MEEKKVQVFLSNGVEEVEALTSIDLLKRAGADVTIIKVLDKEERDSIKDIKDNEDYSEELETLIIGSHDIAFYADFSILDFEDTSFDDEDFLDLASVDMVVIPGGMGNVNNLMSDKTLLKYLDYQYKKGIYISAICAGPMVLHKAGILNNKNITCYPGCEEGLDNITWQDKNVVVDKNIITSKGVGTAIDFALELIKTLYGEEKRKKISSEIIYNK